MDDEPNQSPEELAAHFGPDGPVAAASDWLRTVIEERDYATAWASMTDTLRLVRSQAWLWNNRQIFERAAEDLDEQATLLAAVPSTHPFWEDFAEIEVNSFIESYPPEDYANTGIASRPRPLAPGLELVLVIKMNDAEAIEGATKVASGAVIAGGTEAGTAVNAFAQIVVQHDGTHWRVAGHNAEQLPQPGWPPVI